ncbi:MAG: hypothetical protein ETSY1_10525 [Candidatus Entotheonella factor]|uniref:SGNH hydrolase-type esterase domain-containing protein n=1 Tax=Entotheonella factor TaxID=1429438 RepID=W4LRD3_ENTF1|nr:MAG: hypothetical protein ETSY1_10525 [Candidatus Entotheonella factor]
MKFKKKPVLFAVVLALLVIGVLELTLSLLARVSPQVDRVLASPWPSKETPHTLPDERLGYRPNPAYPGHDRLGFRNPDVPARADIVVLGDSQTYGTGVAPAQAWPRQLASMTGHIVYNMAYGGYGPAHRLMLWDEAVALQPNLVIEAFYAGNDLYESFDLVYNRRQLSELKSADPQLQAVVREAEQSEPIAERVSQMFRMGVQSAAASKAPTTAHPQRPSLRKLLSADSKLYGLLRRTQYEAVRLMDQLAHSPREQWEQAKAFAAANPAYCQVLSHGRLRTILTSEYRLSALDLDDPRIAEGLQISLRSIHKMHELATARNMRFLVLLVPTKETVFRNLGSHPAVSYRRLTDQEARFWATTKAFLARRGIEYLDALPALQGQLAAGVQPYPMSQDGHPNRHGHQAIAKLVANHLSQPD